jgi:hypothetical protein
MKTSACPAVKQNSSTTQITCSVHYCTHKQKKRPKPPPNFIATLAYVVPAFAGPGMSSDRHGWTWNFLTGIIRVD